MINSQPVIGHWPVFPERGFKPVTNFMRNLSALSSWYSVYTSAIAFIVSPHADGQRAADVQLTMMMFMKCDEEAVMSAGLFPTSDEE